MANRPLSHYPFAERVPEGDNRPRIVCTECGWIHYQNPKVVVGAICSYDAKILLCRRSIEPRRGYWTMPAGFLEERESTEAGVLREAREEACAELEIDALLGIYNIPRISQVQLIYRARLLSPDVAAGEETLEVALFPFDAIPWERLAFPSVAWALRCWERVVGRAAFPPFTHVVSGE